MTMHGRFEAPEDPSVGELFARLTEDGKAAVRSEIALYRSALSLRLARARRGLILAIAAIVVIHLSLIAGAVYLTAALATLIGPLAAGLVVIIGGLLVGYVLIRMAIAGIKPAFAPIEGRDR